MEEYVTRIGDVTIQRVIPGGAGPNVEPVRVMESEELLRAVKEEPLDDDEEEEEDLGEGEENIGIGLGEEDERDEETIKIKEEPRNEDEDEDKVEESESRQDDEKEVKDEEEKDEEEEGIGEGEDEDEDSESSKRKADDDEDAESKAKKKKLENEMEADKKKISNLRRNIREVMDEAQLDEATLAAQRQEAERLRRVQDQQKYLREVQRQIQINKQNSKTQSRVISLLQGGSTSLLKTSAVSSTSSSNSSSAPSTVLVKLGSGQQQALNRKTLEVLRGGKTIATAEPARHGITRVTPGNRPAMVTPSVSIAPVKPIVPDGQKKDPSDADVVTISSSSDSEDDCILISEGEGEEEEEEDDVDTTNSGMHTNDLYNIPDEQGRVMINVGKPESEPEIYLAPQIARIIKPHQIGGVRFLFDNVVESIERFNTSTGFGCILAHSMGLGKTLQVVSFCDVFLRETTAKTVMCIMPINTLQNWMAEFNLWLPTDPSSSPLAVHGEVRPRNFGIFVLNDMHKTIAARAKVVEEWNKDGGVLLIGYEMYRQLSLKRPGRLRKGKKRPPEEDVEDEKNKPLLEAMHEALVRPGPDLVICDEGHRIKNSHASISHALKQIRTKRRVVLTGYPLQNNLLEYWCMVDFVRPNYLGTKTEFSNMFERPIQNGQCIDSTPQDIRLMRYRAHVLHSLLEGFVQRRSHSVLRNTLPQKEEYVILVRMTSFQRKLYDTFMNEVVRTKAVPNPLKAFAVCCKIWNHPDILYNFIKKKELDELQDLDIEETANLHTGPNSPRRPLAPKEKKGKTVKKQAQVAAIKPEVAAPPQQVTPEVKTEDRKFDFSSQPPQGSGAGGPPGYGEYYPSQPFSSELSYPYHRPQAPGMYYPGPGYYPENSGYYPGYEGAYPGYFGNFGTYAGSKNEEFDKQSWGNNYGGNKDKNQSKSPKDFESSKPGYQEFYPIKEEKPEIKEEKQFVCGFSEGQVYNYRNFSGYSEYPYPTQDYPPGWNKGNFQNLPQGETPASGNRDKTGQDSSDKSGDPKGSFNNPTQQDSAQRMNMGHDRSQSQTVRNQNVPHTIHERNQSNQNINETQSLHSSSDQQRLHSAQEGIGPHARSSSHDSLSSTRMNMTANQLSDDMRRSNQEHSSGNQQGFFGNQRSDGSQETSSRNQDNSLRNRNTQEGEVNRFHNTSQLLSAQQALHTTHDQLQRTQSNIYGTKNSLENDYRIPSNPEHLPNAQTMFNNFQSNKDYLSSNQSLNNMQNSPENARDQNLIHQQNNFNSQRPDHLMQGEHMLGIQNLPESQPRMHNPQEGKGGNQSSFISQDHQKSPRNPLSVHDQHRANSNQEHQSVPQQNMYRNQRGENSMQTSQEHFSGSQSNVFGNERGEHSLQEQISGNQKTMFGNQRTESSMQMNSDNMSSTPQSLYMNPRNEHSLQFKKENVQNNPQNLYGSHRGDHSLQNNPELMSHHNMFMNQRSENSGQVNTEHLISNQQNPYGSQQRSEHNNPEHVSGMQQNLYGKQQDEYNLQRNPKQMPSSQDMFRNQRNEIHLQSGMENISGSQQNMFTNQRTEHGLQASQDQRPFSFQGVAGNQNDNQRRNQMPQEQHLAMNNQHNLYGGRTDLGPQTNQEQMQPSSLGKQEKDLQHRSLNLQEQQMISEQMFGSQRNEMSCNPDQMQRHQESFTGNLTSHEVDSQNNNQGIKANNTQGIFTSQRIDQNAQNNPEKTSQQQLMSAIQEKINQERFNSGLNRFGNQDPQQNIYRGKNIHDNQHKLHTQMSQQNVFGNQDIKDNPRSHHQSTKRSSSANDLMPVAQHQESYGSQGIDHSMQKIMKTDNQAESQQMIRSVQEHSSHFGMFPDSDNQYRNCSSQEIQNSRTKGGENQCSQESPHRMPMNTMDRNLRNQQHNPQDLKQPNHNYFSNQNTHDSQGWLHNNQELQVSQQNMFDSHGALRRDDPYLVNQNVLASQQKFHNTQDSVSISQQNIYMVPSNQNINQRQEHMTGKQPGAQNLQENQYRLSSSQDINMQQHQQNQINAIQRQLDTVHGSPQNVMGRRSMSDHGLDHQPKQGMTSNSGIFGNQLQRSAQGEMHHSEQMVSQHGVMGNIMGGKHGLQSNQEYVHNNQCGSGNTQNIAGNNASSITQQQSGSNANQTHGLSGSQHVGSANNQEMMKANQNISSCQNYGLSNASSQPGGREHQNSQTGVLSSNSQVIPRQQHGSMNQYEIQQGSTIDNNSGNQHSAFGNQFSAPVSQQSMTGFSNQIHHIQNSQQAMNSCSSSTFGNQHLSQGSTSGGGQGLHGNQSHNQSNQHQFIGDQSAMPPQMHNKEGIQGSSCISNYGGNPGQYMPPTSQQNVPVSQHNTSSSQTMSKGEQQKIQGSPQNVSSHQHNKTKSNQGLSVSQQGTQTGPEHSPQMSGTQLRAQHMLGQTGHQQPKNSFDQTFIMSNKGMSGGQVMQGSAGSPEQFMNERFQGNFSKTGLFGQDFQFPFQNQFPFQENQFTEQPGPSGQKFRKEDDKSDEGKSKEVEKKQNCSEEGKEGTKTSTSSTNTEREQEKDKKDKKDEDDKAEKKEGTSKSNKEDPGIPYDWATELLKGYIPGDISASAKMAVFFCILEESIALGDRILVFSQSLFTLNLMEELLQQQLVPGREERWARNVNYFRLDGSTTAMEREKLINEFNSNINLHLFLVSTRAGSLGINLVGANRVIVFDASWNPCHDTQAVCRVYRYGQKKPCFVYRLVTDNCLEKKIYDRQINKQGMSDRVVDECNPDAHLSIKEVTSLCWDDKTEDDAPKDFSSLQDSYIDVVLQKVIQKHSNLLSKEPFQHESLLVDRKEKKLSQAEKRLAKRSYELEKQASTRPVYNGVQPNQVRPKPMASVRPMQAEMGQTRQRGWIPASVWQRQGMSAQEMTLPLDVVIPTNAADRSSIVLKAGQKVMVLKSPKGIYMQLENGKIIAIRTTVNKFGANKKPIEQQGKGDASRRGGRQQISISPRGRPVRAVGPVSRPPPVTVTVTRKRPPEEEPPPARREEDTSSNAPPPTAPVTPMEVSGTEKDAPNPFTAAAAASLSSMQLPQQLPSQSSVSQQTQQSNAQPPTGQAPHQQQAQQTEQIVKPQSQPNSNQPQQSSSTVQFPPQPIQPTQHSQQPVSQTQQTVHQSQQQPPQQQPTPPQQQPIPPQQQPIPPQQHPNPPQQQPIPPQQQSVPSQQQTMLPQQQPLPPQQMSQQKPIVPQQQLQHSHLSTHQPLQSHHQTISHPQLNKHHTLPNLIQLPSQQLQQPISPHQFPPKPIAPHSQIPPQPPHIQHPIPHSPFVQPGMPHPQLPLIPHPQLAQSSHPLSQPHHLPPSHLQMHPMPHPQLHSLPIPPHSQMHQSISSHSQIPSQALAPHPQIPHQPIPHMQQPLPHSQFPQQSMLQPQVPHPQHYEPPPISPLVGDQLT